MRLWNLKAIRDAIAVHVHTSNIHIRLSIMIPVDTNSGSRWSTNASTRRSHLPHDCWRRRWRATHCGAYLDRLHLVLLHSCNIDVMRVGVKCLPQTLHGLLELKLRHKHCLHSRDCPCLCVRADTRKCIVKKVMYFLRSSSKSSESLLVLFIEEDYLLEQLLVLPMQFVVLAQQSRKGFLVPSKPVVVSTVQLLPSILHVALPMLHLQIALPQFVVSIVHVFYDLGDSIL
mmetsp:Transcript_65553/g.102344  ORF Transcript_65553/g.102344 Transcript_65553/m.102344 type:complete len:230 (-) Transcript_65553:1155-1844(-)